MVRSEAFGVKINIFMKQISSCYSNTLLQSVPEVYRHSAFVRIFNKWRHRLSGKSRRFIRRRRISWLHIILLHCGVVKTLWKLYFFKACKLIAV